LRLGFKVDTASVGTLQIIIAAGAYRWNVTFFGPYSDDRQLLIIPDHVTNGTFEYSMSVCGIREATVTAKSFGHYSISNATLTAYVPDYDPLVNSTEDRIAPSCSGAWNGQALVDVPPTAAVRLPSRRE
jgi:hypothetical protein